MSIFKRTGEPAPFDSLARRLDLFADREKILRLFLHRVNDEDPDGRIIFMHGMGGNGKSLLLRYLQARCCRRFDEQVWTALAANPAARVLDQLADDTGRNLVANALIDFGARPVGQQRPLEALPGLFILKRQLAEYGIKTPRFDFAAVNYLQKSGLAYKQVLPDLFPSSELDLAISIADFLSGLPLVSAGRALLKIFEERTNDALAKWRMAKAIEKEHIAKIIEASADPVLADLLPYYFATDLNAALASEGKRSRIVLFCDTHESFWGEEAFPAAGMTSLAALARDKWLRILLGHLDLERGIVIMVASRKPPRWSQAEEAAIPDDCIDLQRIGGLTPDDARWYLEMVGITEQAAQRLVISYASGSPDEVHPYMLGLCTDVIASQGSDGLDLGDSTAHVEGDLAARRRRLVARLMSSVSEDRQRQVVAVAACRSFDFETFAFLAGRLDFAGSLEAYRRLVNFSFILETAAGTDSTPGSSIPVYSVHQLLRRELNLMFTEESTRAHAALVEFYRQKQDPASMAEATLHLTYADHAAGIELWCTTMDSYLKTGRYADCQAFIGVVADTPASAKEKSESFYNRVAHAYLGIGALAEAEALCQQLPQDSAESMLLKADIEFYRCEFEAAENTARAGIQRTSGANRERMQLRLAEILLYRGIFAAAREVLASVRPGGAGLIDNADLTRTMLAGEVALFAGDTKPARRLFGECRHWLEAKPSDELDLTILGWNLADRGLVHLVEQEWDDAFADAEGALRVREEVSHARGMANSLFLMGRARCGASRHDEGRVYLGRAGKLARDQGDEVTLAKIRQAEAMSRFATGDLQSAIELLEESVQGTKKRGVPYDLAHALLDMSQLRRAAGDVTAAVTALEEARRILTQHEFGLLRRLYPETTQPPYGRLRAGIVCFAAGDALGAPWEGRPPSDISFAPGDPLPRRGNWPVGATTDDTDQILAAIDAVVTSSGVDLAKTFLENLARALPTMRGVGPTTPAAVSRYLETGTVVAEGGTTNGACARALAVGWAVPPSMVASRRRITEEITRSTHGSPEAVLSAHLIAAMASWAVEGVSGQALAKVALRELDEVTSEVKISAEHEALIRSAAQGNWEAPGAGVTMQAVDTVAAVLAMLTRSGDPAEAMLASLRLGGDTDSVAGLVGGLLGTAAAETGAASAGVAVAVESAIPWLPHVKLPPAKRLTEIAVSLAAYRCEQYG